MVLAVRRARAGLAAAARSVLKSNGGYRCGSEYFPQWLGRSCGGGWKGGVGGGEGEGVLVKTVAGKPIPGKYPIRRVFSENPFERRQDVSSGLVVPVFHTHFRFGV